MQAVTNTGATALTTVAATIAELVGPGSPGTLIIGSIPSVTGISSADTVTANIVRLDTGAVIGAATFGPGTAAAAEGGIVVVAVAPVGNAGGFALQALTSAATASAVGSATAPCILATLP